MKGLLIEALFVGIITVIVGSLVSLVISLFYKSKTKNKDWNKYYVMEIALFLTGVFIHIGCEITGINKWYCKNGNACKR